MAKTLWLFDIDGTLVNINEIHLKSYKRDYMQILERPVPDDIITSTFGLSEHEMHNFILAKLGAKDMGLVQKLIEVHPKNFLSALSNETIKPLEGVVEFLDYLRKKNDYLGIVTGNLKEPASAILKHCGLSKYFSILSYDDGTKTRAEIVASAIETARKMKYEFGSVVVIGDTTKDIAAGFKAGALTVAVATGSDSYEKLLGHSPNLAIKSLAEYSEILKILE